MKRHILTFFLLAFIFCAIQTARAQNYTISTIAGDGVPGYNGDGIAATDAELNDPINSCADKFGNVYVSDNYNYRICKVSTNGVITTYAGDGNSGYSGDNGQATNAELESPSSGSCDDKGNLYIADFLSNVIRKVDINGIITTFAGNGSGFYSGDGGAATNAGIGLPRCASLDDSGNIYIADQTNYRVRKVNTSGIISTVAGDGAYGYSGDGGAATNAELGDPTAVAIDDSGNIYIADGGDNVIRKVNTKGIISTLAGTGIPGFSGDGGQATIAELDQPLGVAADIAGNVYIVDNGSQRVRKVNATTGIITTIAGTGVEGHTGDGGPALLAELGGPIGLSIDSLGNLYVTEFLDGNNDVRVLSHCTLSFTINPSSPPPICNGQSVMLTAGGGTFYQWSPSVGLSATSGDSVIANPTATATYMVTASDTAGCMDTKYIVITVNPHDTLIIQPPSPSVCSGQSTILSVPVSGSDYSWSPPSTLSSSTGDSVFATPTIETTYTVTGTDSSGCAVSGSDVVYISPTPAKPVITQSGNVLTSSATQGNQWVRNDSVLQGATNQNYTVIAAGWYEVIAENPANGCSATSDSGYYTPTGIKQLTVNSGQVTVYPNPTSSEIFVNINSSAGEVKDWNLQITDVLGRAVFTKQSLNHSNNIDLSNLSSGVYFISVINKTGKEVIPVVKQ